MTEPTNIADAITAAQGRVADCYTAVSNKGGTLPATRNLANLPSAITSISGGGGGSTINNQDKTITVNGSYTADAGYTGLGTVTVNVDTVNNTSLSITPSTSSQSFTASSPYTGYGTVTVNAVTSSIDSNIQAENIKNGVSILGVSGTYTGSGGSSTKYGATIDTLLGDVNASGVLQPPSSGLCSLTFTGVNDIASNALTYRFCKNNSIGSVTFPDLTTVSGTSCMESAFDYSSITSINLPNLVTISAQYGMRYMCRSCPNLQSINFSKLETISGQYSLAACFVSSSGITSCGFPELQTVSATGALNAFLQSTSIVTMSFPKLSILTGNGCLSSCFSICPLITDIYFNALTTTSFGTLKNQFNGMFNSSTAGSSGNVNVHFPSNLETTISGLTGYPLFGGRSGRVTLLFDLPTTS